MADTKVSAGTAETTPAGTDLVPTSQGAVSKTLSLDQIAAYAAAQNFCILASDYTLTSSTGVQKLFNTTTNGAVTLALGLYWFEAQFQITGMSATSGNGVFSLAGTAVLAKQMMSSLGIDATAMVTGAAGSFALVQAGSAFTTSMATASTGTGLGFTVRGLFSVTTSGTVIPSIALTTAAAAVVKAGSSIIIERIGASTDTTRGSWS